MQTEEGGERMREENERLKREVEEMKREIERMKREMDNGISFIRNVNETVVKIPNRQIAIQEGNTFHNKSDKAETIIIGNKMSRVCVSYTCFVTLDSDMYVLYYILYALLCIL